MKVSVLLIGKNNEKYISDGMDIYSNRLIKYCGFEVITVPDIKNTRNMPIEEQKSREGKKIIEQIGKDDFCVLMDERGVQYRTVEFAEWMRKQMVFSPKRILFVIGGPYGFSEEVYQRADFKISLSKLTFPHQLVRLLFMEQLYRAFTVIKGEPYHHE
jgi:23S rRNA (pseudouridine1915-N3)-methyltransferase